MFDADENTLAMSHLVVAPLPGINRTRGFGSAVVVNSADFRGNIGFPQHKIKGFVGEPAGNIEGFKTYSYVKDSWSAQVRNPQGSFTQLFYKREYARTYVFTDLPALLGPGGEGLPVYRESTIPAHAIQTSPTGITLSSVPNSRTEIVDAANSRFWGGQPPSSSSGSAQPPDQYTQIGSGLYSVEITNGWLLDHLGTWKELSQSIRDRTEFTPIATQSESLGGTYGRVQGFYASINYDMTTGSDRLGEFGVTEDEDENITGWDESYGIIFTAERRVNWPVIWDNIRSTLYDSFYPDDIFTETNMLETLSDEITSKKFRDAHGIFDPDENDTFEDIGWGSASMAGLLAEQAVFPLWDAVRLKAVEGGEVNQDGIIQLVSADGGTYRVQLAVGYWTQSGTSQTWTTLHEQSLTLQPATPVTAQFPRVDLRAEISDSNENIRALKIEEMKEGGFVEVPDKIMRDRPGLGVAVLALSKSRIGTRWGFPGLDPERDSTRRYRARRFMRESVARSEPET